MTLFFLLRLLHLAAMILWLGVGLSIPVALDIRRSLALGIAQGEGLVTRLSTISALVIPAGLTTFCNRKQGEDASGADTSDAAARKPTG